MTLRSTGSIKPASRAKATSLLVLPEIIGGALVPVASGGLQFFFADRGVLNFLSSPKSTGNLDELRVQIDKSLGAIMNDFTNASFGTVLFRLKTLQLFEKLLPFQLRDHLRRVADSTKGQRPTLFIYSDIDWVPWELMYDGINFLGVTFQIARLPVRTILDQGFATDEAAASEQEIDKVASLLGKNTFEDKPSLIGKWEKTFGGVQLVPARQIRHSPLHAPPDLGTFDKLFSNAADAPDILHITCHGGRESNIGGITEIAWTFDHKGVTFAVDITNAVVAQICKYQGFSLHQPLVFGNACSSAAAGADKRSPSFGFQFLKGGASAFVGTLAPVSQSMAVDFASVFYQRLLTDKKPIGEALRSTKQHFSKQPDSSDPSWLFYVLYGSPETRYTLKA